MWTQAEVAVSNFWLLSQGFGCLEPIGNDTSREENRDPALDVDFP